MASEVDRIVERETLKQENRELRREILRLKARVANLEAERGPKPGSYGMEAEKRRILKYLTEAQGWVFSAHLAAGNPAFGSRAITLLLQELSNEGYVEIERLPYSCTERYRISPKGLTWVLAQE